MVDQKETITINAMLISELFNLQLKWLQVIKVYCLPTIQMHTEVLRIKKQSDHWTIWSQLLYAESAILYAHLSIIL